MKKTILVFIGVNVLLLFFFYFYKVDLFQAEVTSNGTTFIKEVNFSEFFVVRTLPYDYAIKPTLQGWLLLAAIFFGLPAMLAYRVNLKRYPRRAAEKEN